MFTEKSWKSISFFIKIMPPKLFFYDEKQKTFRKLHYKFFVNPWVCFYLFYGFVNGGPTLINIAYRIQNVPMSTTLMAIHIVTLFVLIIATSLGVVCAHTLVGNDDFCILFDTILRYQIKSFGKHVLT